MKRMPFLIVALLLFFTSALAQTDNSKAAQNSDSSALEKELKGINREMHDALGRGDKEKLFSFFADDFIGTSHDGFTATKEDLVKNFKTPPRNAKITREIEDFKVRGGGDSAIASYRVIERVEYEGQRDVAVFLYTDTFTRRDGRWLMIASQATAVKPERKVAQVDPAVYDAYVGQYALSPDAIFVVTREGNKLMGRAPSGETVELLPENETTFFIKDKSGQTIFVKDASGKVSHMIIRNHGDGLKMRRIN